MIVPFIQKVKSRQHTMILMDSIFTMSCNHTMLFLCCRYSHLLMYVGALP